MPEVPILPGLDALAARYDGFLLDSWGVLQNGVAPLAGANDCLAALKQRGKRLVILSNSARRASVVAGELAAVGVAMAHVDAVLTGGEAAWQALQSRKDESHQNLGRKCFYLGSRRSASLLDGLALDLTSDIAAASFILCTSPPDGGLMDAARAQLELASARGLTMLCANPDLTAFHGEEQRACAGEVARIYEVLGGHVIYHGKPHAPFYRMAQSAMAGIPPARILAVGDAFATDFAGAAGAGLDALLVMSGIHRDELPAGSKQPARLAALCGKTGFWPVAAVQHFTW